MAFESGDIEVFQYDDVRQFSVVGGEKSKEHETSLTGLDYNSKLGMVVTSDESGIIKLWTSDKRFLREIVFPHPVDSVCFFNAEGDLLVSHDNRVSTINFKRYKLSAFDFILSHEFQP